jgi:hypothetical protein
VHPASTAAPAGSKVSAAHLRRAAYLYVRQSTIKQVLTNTESTRRQYDLRGRAIAPSRHPPSHSPLVGRTHLTLRVRLTNRPELGSNPLRENRR